MVRSHSLTHLGELPLYLLSCQKVEVDSPPAPEFDEGCPLQEVILTRLEEVIRGEAGQEGKQAGQGGEGGGKCALLI